MELVLSAKTKAKIFNRKMGREKLFSAHIKRWQDRTECMMTNIRRKNSSYGFYTLRVNEYSHMGEYNSPIYNIRASKMIRDTEAMLRRFSDPQEKQKLLEQTRWNEVRGELRDKWKSLLNRNNFFSQVK